jgi:hypothetical protein
MGVQTWFIIGGLVTIVMGVAGIFIPAVMHFEEGRGAVAPQRVERPVETSPGAPGVLLDQAARTTTAKIDFT